MCMSMCILGGSIVSKRRDSRVQGSNGEKKGVPVVCIQGLGRFFITEQALIQDHCVWEEVKEEGEKLQKCIPLFAALRP